MIKEKTSVRILINGNLEKTAKAQIINGKELEIKTKTIGGNKYMPVNRVTEFFERKYPGEKIRIESPSSNSQTLKSTNKIVY